MSPERRPVLVLGATGYVGARLVRRLCAAGHPVRAAGRSLRKLAERGFSSLPGVVPVPADVLDPRSLDAACAGCSAAYYLVHSMESGRDDFAAADREAASNMAAAAGRAGLSQVVYLGGLGESSDALSEHLKSRAETASILRAGPVPATHLRAAMVLGAGSGSFEILRYLVERLPVMITPRWLDTEVQPVAVSDALDALVGVLGQPGAMGETFDLGAADATTYRRLMAIYAEEAGLPRRIVIPVPILSPRLSSWWIDLVTPLPAALARPLAEGLRNRVVCGDTRIRAFLPRPPMDCRTAVRAAIANVMLPPDGCGALRTDADAWPGDPAWAGGTTCIDRYQAVVRAAPGALWREIVRIGGDRGWYHLDSLWRLRGAVDRLLGGGGFRKGRRDGESLLPGDPVDFWRVEAVVPGKRLRLRAEMRMPGHATLSFRLREAGDGTTEVWLEARFVPRGLTGLLYWAAVDPLHGNVFPGLLRAIAARAGGTLLMGPDPVRAERIEAE